LSTLLASPQLQHIYHVTLGFQDSFLLTWRDTKGQDRIDSAGLPTELTNFLLARNPQRQLTRNIPQLRGTLGPSTASFFVHDTAAYLWMDIPPALLSALESRIKNGGWTDPPRIVALGADAAFLLVTAQHAATWDLDAYPGLTAKLNHSRTQAHGLADLHNVILHAYRYNAFITQTKTGSLMHENPPPHALSAMESMAEPMKQDSKFAARPVLDRRVPSRHVLERHAFERETEASPPPPPPRRPSTLQQRAQVRREWSEHRQQFSAQAQGLKLSLSLSISAGGLARMLG
jgi:hypothetical protein